MNLFSKKLLVVLIAGASQLAFAAGPVATVNGTAIPQDHADALISEQTAKGTPDNEQLRGAVREELVRREILYQTAQKEGLDKTPEVATQIELARKAVVIRAYLQGFVAKHPVTDADVRKAYDEIKGRLGDTEYHVRHILVEDEAEARALIAKINKGEKFDALAKAHSKDPGSKDKGGDLGWNNPGTFVQPFSDAMVKLEKGKMTPAPVKTNFGYHIIKLDDTRKMSAPEFDQVAPQLKQRLQAQSLEQHILQLRTAADVK
ncbi:peptidylprolyl isomerase [Denitromonas iodatirespirans]|uniref:peptidylprolyl isomerase n=1 Tax=Denitromonas iodatirespirans TaxID=2795389 RepID=A0A944D8Z5_DENI1|nr:peptidylprolyl isomerase [Denitromonas iodatirespirans]MBT0960721.1 peptidylprolyl isomerase [Denitromonas iodatirespirans]